MSLRGLAEGIIMQSIEDLWNDRAREESIMFFKGNDFTICAEKAGMTIGDQLKLLNMVKNIIECDQKKACKPVRQTKPGLKKSRVWQEGCTVSL